MNASVTELPFNRFVGIEVASDATQLLRLPEAAHYLNHLGTVHASALLALAEASSGELLLRHLGTSQGVVAVVRRIEAKFRKPAKGAVTSTASAASDALAELDAGLAGKSRGLVTVAVELHDEAGTHALSASVEWFIQKSVPRP
jgi:acyl-coenzyme A thioesterase PaaI-like protein